MMFFNHDAPTEITSDWMRSNLRAVLDRVRHRDERFLIKRRGAPLAGLVPIYEANALYEIATRPVEQDRLLRQLEELDRRNLADAVREARARFLSDNDPLPGSPRGLAAPGPRAMRPPEPPPPDTEPDHLPPDEYSLDWDEMDDCQRAREIKRREISARLRG